MAEKPNPGRRPLIIAGVIGVLVGSVSAWTLPNPFVEDSTPATDALHAESGPAEGLPLLTEEEMRRDDDPTQPLIDAILSARDTLTPQVDGDAGADRGLSTYLKAEISADEWIVELRRDFHRASGEGQFATPEGLTALGEALHERLKRLEAHAIATEPYQRQVIDEAIKALSELAETRNITFPEALRTTGPVLVSLLDEDEFEVVDARLQLKSLDNLPSLEDVTWVAEQLQNEEPSKELLEAVAKVESRLGTALVRLVLDFKYLYQAGPFKLTSSKSVQARKRLRRKALATLRNVIASDAPGEALVGLEPDHPSYEGTMALLETYRELVDKGGCETDMSEDWKIAPNAKGDRVKKLQTRLACEGYFDGPIDGHYNDALLIAVRDYQRHHGLHDGGYVYKKTIQSLNVSMSYRVAQIELSLKRMRESRIRELGDYYIRVNLPSFRIQVVEGNSVIRTHKAIVGTNRLDDDKTKLLQGHINRTPLMVTNLYEVIINPDWILPKRVEKGELKTRLAEDPDYLTKKGIIKQTLPGGNVVYIQRAGTNNALGKVKFLLEESRAIFLHDTDKPDLFKESKRDFSHGCIRVHKAQDFARFVLLQDGWEEAEIDRSMRAKKTQRGMKLKRPIDVITEYITVDVDQEGKGYFYNDFYGFDKAYFKDQLPAKITARWGGPVLRPHWVPRVPEDVVERWRASGKPAPHNYKPGM